MTVLGFISLIFIALCFLYTYFKNKLLRDKRIEKYGSKIPGPISYPLIGSAWIFKGKEPNSVVSDLVQQYGSVFRVWLGSNLYIVLTDPDDVEVILNGSKHLSKADSYNFVKSWLGNGLITAEGKNWQTRRKFLTPTFHFKILEQSLNAIYNHSLVLVDQLRNELDSPEFDAHGYLEKCSIDVLCESAMGISLNTLRSGNSSYMDACKTVANITVRRIFEIFLQPEIGFWISGLRGKFKSALNILENTSKKVIDERKQELACEQPNRKSLNESDGRRKVMPFLDMLLSESSFTDDEIQDEVKSFMFAGHDTTTSAMSFMIHQLALHQDVQDKVFEEIENKLPAYGTCPTIQDLNNLRYLDQVIKESLRLYPPVPMIGRELSEDLKLPSGYTLPRGAHVNIYIYSIHRNPKIYEDPSEFKPERFAAADNLNRSPFAYIPFSAGSRNCIGQRFALLEIKIILSNVLRMYRIMPTDRTSSIRLVSQLILRSLDGIPIRLVARVR